MANIHDVGDVVTITGTFRDASGAVVDPTAVTAQVLDPAGTVANPTATRISAGVYAFTISVTAAGIWRYRLEGTGANAAAAEGVFAARSSSF